MLVDIRQSSVTVSIYVLLFFGISCNVRHANRFFFFFYFFFSRLFIKTSIWKRPYRCANSSWSSAAGLQEERKCWAMANDSRHFTTHFNSMLNDLPKEEGHCSSNSTCRNVCTLEWPASLRCCSSLQVTASMKKRHSKYGTHLHTVELRDKCICSGYMGTSHFYKIRYCRRVAYTLVAWRMHQAVMMSILHQMVADPEVLLPVLGLAF